jgi:NAD+ kinase
VRRSEAKPSRAAVEAPRSSEPVIDVAPEVRNAVLVTHTQPEQTAAAVADAVVAAERAGCRLFIPDSEREKHRAAVEGLEPTSALDGRPDLCLVLGGDGTILKALRAYANTEVPVFAVNFGTVGFLAAVERENLAEGLDAAFGGGFEVMLMPGLEASIDAEPPLALNDVSLIRRQHSRVAELGYSLGGKEVGHVRCDGLVAATPAGSTGYNLANQGPILAWGVEGYVVSFIAPHTLTARPLVVAPDDVLSVTNAAGRDPVDVVLDGEPAGELASGAEMEVRFRDDVGRLAQLPGANFYRRIRDKFGRLAH